MATFRLPREIEEIRVTLTSHELPQADSAESDFLKSLYESRIMAARLGATLAPLHAGLPDVTLPPGTAPPPASKGEKPPAGYHAVSGCVGALALGASDLGDRYAAAAKVSATTEWQALGSVGV
jgi:hypothetical protein